MNRTLDIYNHEFLHFIKYIHDAVVIANKEGTIVLINPQTEEIFGYSQEELLGESVDILIPKHMREAHKRHREDYNNKPKARLMSTKTNLIGRRKDGSEVPLNISLSPWRYRDEVLVIAMIRDITERRRAEEELKWTKKFKTLHTVTQTIHKSHDLEEVYNIALDMATELDNVYMACIYLVDKYRKEAILQAHRNLLEDYVRRAGRIPYPKGAIWEVINTDRVLNIGNVQKDFNVGPAGRYLGHHGALGIPITSEQYVIGVIWFFSYKERRFDEDEIGLLTSIGDQIATAIAKAKLYGDLARKSRYEEIIRTVTQNVHRSIDLQEVIENATGSLSENIDVVDVVGIYMVEGEEAVLRAQRGLTGSYIERAGRIPYPKGLTWKTILEGKPRYCVDADKDEYMGPAGRKEGIKSYLSMPIAYEGNAVGCITVTSKQKNAIDEEELHLLELVSHQITIAMKNATQADLLRQSEQRYRILFDQSPVGVYIFDKELNITQCNKRLVEILQTSYDKVMGLNMKELKDKSFVPAMERTIQGRSSHHEKFYKATTSSADLRLSLHFSPLRDVKGEVIGGLGVVEDIFERKRIEESMLKTEKLESVGILAGGIAHDFNNLLTVILGNISLTLSHTEKNGRVYKRLQEAENATLRATNLTNQLLTFSKGGEPVKVLSSIEEIVKESAGFALRGSNVRCEYSIPPDLWSAEIDKGQISQVINNLVINARQAMPEGGAIKLSAENTTVGKEHDNLRGGDYIKIRVKDEGTGIPEKHLQKIFDPYFTTKQKGSGLGLATSYSIISKHGGLITADSEMGVGTTFTIYIPANGKVIQKDKESQKHVLEVAKWRVLVMDDEEVIRKVVGMILGDMGHRVRFAGDEAEAVELYKEALEEGNPFDAVILDLTIRGEMGGKETIKNLIRIDPNVKAIVSSGYSNDPVMANFEKYGFKGLVAKPYRSEELIQVLSRAICSER